jgi:hypothetical protein
MRMMINISIPLETGNAAAKAGTLGTTIEKILTDLKPEASYFFVNERGERSGFIVFDMQSTAQLPEIAEPWFLAFNAKVMVQPVMNMDDLILAGLSIVKAGHDYGKPFR